MEYLQSPRSENKNEKTIPGIYFPTDTTRLTILGLFDDLSPNVSDQRVRLTILGRFDGLWPVGTRSPLAPILGHERKVAMSPSSTVHGGQYDTQ